YPHALYFNDGSGDVGIGTTLTQYQPSITYTATSIDYGNAVPFSHGFSIRLWDGAQNQTRGTALYWEWYFYYGSSANPTMTSNAEINALNAYPTSGKGFNYNFTGIGQYLYIAYPVVWGTPSIYVNGTIQSAWVAQGSGGGNFCVASPTPNSLSHTNSAASPQTTNYYVCRSPYPLTSLAGQTYNVIVN
ncbi:MAG: hypothetical protein HQL14_08855, partial [Candidatus Omnitrophica bacterium]|nr:hypothetical protein [Candidatus Omnitrophota bacterium]